MTSAPLTPSLRMLGPGIHLFPMHICSPYPLEINSYLECIWSTTLAKGTCLFIRLHYPAIFFFYFLLWYQKMSFLKINQLNSSKIRYIATTYSPSQLQKLTFTPWHRKLYNLSVDDILFIMYACMYGYMYVSTYLHLTIYLFFIFIYLSIFFSVSLHPIFVISTG